MQKKGFKKGNTEYICFFLALISAMPSRSDRQKVVRKNHVRYIVKRLASKLSTPEHQKRMITTNRILPLGSLKRKVVHQIFAGWVKNKFRGMGRVFTYKLAALVVKRLRDKLDLPECHDIKDEVKKMQYFLKTARKRLGKLPAMSSVDEMVTMPMFFGQCQCIGKCECHLSETLGGKDW